MSEFSLSFRTYCSENVSAMKQSVSDLIKALECARGGYLNFGKGSAKAAEQNWALTKPALLAQTVRSWIEDKPLPMEIDVL